MRPGAAPTGGGRNVNRRWAAAAAGRLTALSRGAGWRQGRFGLGLSLALLLAVVTPDIPALAAPPTQDAGSRMGLAHVDLMDLHLARRPDGAPMAIQPLDDAQIAQRYAQARATGAGWNRWTLYRDLVETGRPYDWSVPDGIIGRDRAHGLRTLLILQSQAENLDAPVFLTQDGRGTDDPAAAARVNDGHVWARFVAAAVERYGRGGAVGGVGAWEIGNEPDIDPLWRDRPEAYARFLEVASLVIKRADPAAVVLHGSMADEAQAEAWFGRFLDSLRGRAAASPLPERYGFYFDKTAWHWYRSPGLLQTGPARVRSILQEKGIPAKPIWVTETGVPVWSEHPGPCWDPASPGRANLSEQAGFVWQTAAEAFASGVQLLIYFQLVDDCGNGPRSYDAFGLLRNPAGQGCWEPAGDHACWQPGAAAGLPRPAYHAFRLATQLLAGARLLRQVPSAAAGHRVIVFQEGTRRVSVVWSTGGQHSARLPAAAPSATLYTIDGDGVADRPLAATGAGYDLALPAVTNHNGMGGRPIMAAVPVILVENGATGEPPGPAGASSVGPAGKASDVAPDPATLAEDHAPPVLAAVEPLPELSPALPLRLSVIAGDPGSGVAAWILYVAEGAEPPRDPAAWRPLGGVRPWTAPGAAGQEALSIPVVPGRRYHFAAQAADRAGNWTDLPPYSQASTRIADADRDAVDRDAPPPATGVRRSGLRPRASHRPAVIAE